MNILNLLLIRLVLNESVYLVICYVCINSFIVISTLFIHNILDFSFVFFISAVKQQKNQSNVLVSTIICDV